MALLAVWYTDFFGAQTVASCRTSSTEALPAYLQQLTMESNGKCVALDGSVTYDTSPIYWGEPGTNGQHSFYQLIHQGTRLVPCDFIAFAQPLNALAATTTCSWRMSSLRARPGLREDTRAGQSGGHPDWLVPHRVFEGNRRRTRSSSIV